METYTKKANVAQASKNNLKKGPKSENFKKRNLRLTQTERQLRINDVCNWLLEGKTKKEIYELIEETYGLTAFDSKQMWYERGLKRCSELHSLDPEKTLFKQYMRIERLIDKCENEDDRASLLKGIDLMNKLLGLYQPQVAIQNNIVYELGFNE